MLLEILFIVVNPIIEVEMANVPDLNDLRDSLLLFEAERWAKFVVQLPEEGLGPPKTIWWSPAPNVLSVERATPDTASGPGAAFEVHTRLIEKLPSARYEAPSFRAGAGSRREPRAWHAGTSSRRCLRPA